MAGLGRLKRSPLTPKSVLLLDVRDVHGAACVCTSSNEPRSAIAAGANIEVVQAMLGHKSATMTLDLHTTTPPAIREA
jgi:hypothetical protein